MHWEAPLAVGLDWRFNHYWVHFFVDPNLEANRKLWEAVEVEHQEQAEFLNSRTRLNSELRGALQGALQATGGASGCAAYSVS